MKAVIHLVGGYFGCSIMNYCELQYGEKCSALLKKKSSFSFKELLTFVVLG